MGRVGRLGLGGAARGPEDPAVLGGLEVVPEGPKVRGTGFPIFSASLTRISRPRMIRTLSEMIVFRTPVARMTTGRRMIYRLP